MLTKICFIQFLNKNVYFVVLLFLLFVLPFSFLSFLNFFSVFAHLNWSRGRWTIFLSSFENELSKSKLPLLVLKIWNYLNFQVFFLTVCMKATPDWLHYFLNLAVKIHAFLPAYYFQLSFPFLSHIPLPHS